MTDHRDAEIGIDAWLKPYGSDPTRLRLLGLLLDQDAGVVEIAAKLALDEEEVVRQVDYLLGHDLIECVEGERPASRYRANVRVLWTEEQLAELSQPEKRRLLAWIARTIEDDVAEAIESGTFEAREDAHAIRTVVAVDEQGWRELSRLHLDTLDAVLAIQAASAERLAERGELGVPALAAAFCCELPQRRIAS